ncbi:MAG TPA: hypothetical protein VF861_14770 [Telluria sp.]
MIYLAISHIAFELNQFLRRSSIACEDIANNVVQFLAGIESDTVPGHTGASHTLIARVIAVFQQHPVFDRNFGRIPSVLYRVRIVGIDSHGVSGRQHIVSEPTVVAHYAKEN